MRTKSIAELMEGAAVDWVHGPAEARHQAVKAIVEDSRCADAGCLFVARPGTADDGRRYIDDAVRRGAAAVLSDRSAAVPGDVAFLTSEDVPLAAARMAESFYDHPSRALRLVGITGTNGKTTTAHLVHQIMTAACAPRPCGLIGTVHIDDGTAKRPAQLTTPPAFDISRWLRTMVDARCGACAMEVSSHALHQKRVAGLEFDIAIFTNLSGDHLDYHRSMEEYARAKAMLFDSLSANGTAIVNSDDPQWRTMVAKCDASVIRCSLGDSEADCFVTVRFEGMRGTEVTMRGPWGSFDVSMQLIGRHNAMNALQAAAACHALGLSADAIRKSLEACAPPPGRLEPVAPPDFPFAVFVDYAHTDDALENVLRAVKPLVPRGGMLRVVFGCGGDRDRTKRPRMAKAACRYADHIIITSDNPRTEDPEAIVREIAVGVPTDRLADTTCITDRREAIGEAIRHAQPGDIIVIAGKGHEDYQIVGREKRPFDDRIVAAEAIEVFHGAPRTGLGTSGGALANHSELITKAVNT